MHALYVTFRHGCLIQELIVERVHISAIADIRKKNVDIGQKISANQ